ncbi:MAG: 3-methyl-2-oxobutanoate hydroxymethyltransferase [Alphaproteobacteria bacterium]
MSNNRKTITDITTQKETGVPIVCLTAYTTPIAKLLDNNCDLLLVGDSLGMALYGMENTLGVTLDIMINHGKAVMRAVNNSCVVVDMPFGTYEESAETAYENALKIINETGCDAVKLEGGQDIAPTIEYITKKGIAVMAHIGLQPQSVVKDGGYKVKGKTDEEISRLINDAKSIEEAGAFAVVIEGTIETVAQEITQSIQIPTIGIGASASCDGQILVTDDMLGLITDHTPKFVKKYANLAQEIDNASKNYSKEVKTRAFPDENFIYKAKAK